jgi:hypothetical protein
VRRRLTRPLHRPCLLIVVPFSGISPNPWLAEHVEDYINNSLVVGSSQWQKLVEAAKASSIYVALAFSEKTSTNLYMAQALLDPNGDVLVHRHKLRPSASERDLWSDGTTDEIVAVNSASFSLQLHTDFSFPSLHPALLRVLPLLLSPCSSLLRKLTLPSFSTVSSHRSYRPSRMRRAHRSRGHLPHAASRRGYPRRIVAGEQPSPLLSAVILTSRGLSASDLFLPSSSTAHSRSRKHHSSVRHRLTRVRV